MYASISARRRVMEKGGKPDRAQTPSSSCAGGDRRSSAEPQLMSLQEIATGELGTSP